MLNILLPACNPLVLFIIRCLVIFKVTGHVTDPHLNPEYKQFILPVPGPTYEDKRGQRSHKSISS